jgi:hypothetical protein
MPAFVPEILIAQLTNGMFSEGAPAGYAVHPAPRRAARGRSGEILFTALALQARTPLPSAELDRLEQMMTQVYFGTAGSVTAALRAAFVAANAEVLPFSQAPSLIGSPSGILVQLHAVSSVLREGNLYLGYGGNILALIFRESGVESYPASGDPPARALGTALNLDLRYGHAVLSPSSTLILAASPATGWTSSVPAGLANLSLQDIGERMAKQSASQPGAFGGLLVRFSAVEASTKAASPIRKVSLFPSKSDQNQSQPARGETSTGIGSQNVETDPLLRGVRPPGQTISKTGPTPRTAPAAPAMPASVGNRESYPSGGEHFEPPHRPPEPSVGYAAGMKAEPSSARGPYSTERVRRPAVSSTQIKERSTEHGLSAREAAGAFGHSVKVTLVSAWGAVRSFLAGILPRGVLPENERFSLPPSVLLGTAIAIPLILVAVVAVMYFRKGYEMEFARLMQEARTEAAVANAQTDPLKAREAWQTVFNTLQTAAKYGSSEELTALQTQAARMLDNFDGITPLEFKPAVAGGLEEGVQITVLLAGDRELYALDSTHDRVLHMMLGQGGYQLDQTFICQAGTFPEISVESLVDMVWVPGLTVGSQAPSSTRSGAVVAMDRKGTLLYCPPDGKAMAGALPDPYTGWSTPAALDYYNGRLYVLDPDRNGFWRYAMSERTGFDQTPSAYFTAGHPSMTDAIDFAVASGEVFFLHADGHVTRCQYDPLFQPEDAESTGGTLCESVSYNDTRPGRTAGPRIEDALLNRIYYNEPPEPTLFFLDPLGRGAYRFSLALNFISRFRVTIAPEGHEATALAVGADKVLFIAIGNQIYYAQTRTP